MQERVRQLLRPIGASRRRREPPSRPTICTFHSLCARILRQHIERLGYKRNFVIYTESDQLGAIKRILSHISDQGGQGRSRRRPGPVEPLQQRRRTRPRLSPTRTRRRWPSTSARATNRPARLQRGGFRRFDSADAQALRRASRRPARPAAQQYRYVMVDEYQDTNAAQFKLVRQLTAGHRNLCVVGDDDQSIYGWRGAETANLLDIGEAFSQASKSSAWSRITAPPTPSSPPPTLSSRTTPAAAANSSGPKKAQGARIPLHTFADDEEEARRTAEEIEYARLARARAVAGAGGPLPHQPAGAPAGNRPAPGRHPLSSHRRPKLF